MWITNQLSRYSFHDSEIEEMVFSRAAKRLVVKVKLSEWPAQEISTHSPLVLMFEEVEEWQSVPDILSVDWSKQDGEILVLEVIDKDAEREKIKLVIGVEFYQERCRDTYVIEFQAREMSLLLTPVPWRFEPASLLVTMTKPLLEPLNPNEISWTHGATTPV